MNKKAFAPAYQALDDLQIEVPSWGFADTGTRFGKFAQDAAAINMEDKLADAGQVNALTGCAPTVAVHVLWDFQPGQNPQEVVDLAAKYDVKIGSINPNVFQDQSYKYGSFGNPDPAVRELALKHCLDCVDLAKAVDSKYISLWFADGTNYPGQDNIRARKARFEEGLKKLHRRTTADQILLVEYKPFEPAFYATDIADWGMAYLMAKKAGKRSRVLVDTGHHYQSQNIEQIVAWLLAEDMLGGFHFNDRRFADDDLTLGSIDPYQIFRIFFEIHSFAVETGQQPEIAYMVDQSHNLKPKVEAMVQTVCTAQELYAKAALVDHKAVAQAQAKGDIVAAEQELKKAFFTDITPVLADWREGRKLAADPIAELRKSGYIKKAGQDRARRRKEMGIDSSGGSYA